MFVVIFRAQPAKQDEQYTETVNKMRQLALEHYGCLDFIAISEGEQEIALSYWESEDAIKLWKNDTEHILAQQQGRKTWYKSYTVQVAEIKREYRYQG